MSVEDELLAIAAEDPDAEEALTEQLQYEDLGVKLVKWWQGGQMGAEEVGRATNTAYANAPQVIKDKYSVDWAELPDEDKMKEDFTYTDKGKATTYSERELQVQDYVETAVNNFQQETLRPVATVAAVFGGEVGLALLAPFMIGDIGKSIDDEDYVGAAKTAAMLALPGVARMGGKGQAIASIGGAGLMGDMALSTGKQVTDEKFQDYANADPFGAIGNVGANLVPMLHPAIQAVKGARSTYLQVKEKLSKAKADAKVEQELNQQPAEEAVMAEKTNKPTEEQQFTPKKAKSVAEEIDMSNNKEVKEKVKSIEERVRERADFDQVEKEVIANGIDTPYTSYDDIQVDPAPVEPRGWLSRLWRGSENAIVKMKDIHDVFNSITPITYGNTGDQGILGWYHNIGQGVRVQKHQFLETICHEVGHYVDMEIMNLGGFTQELASNAKRRWRHGEYGDPTDPANDIAYRNEGVADFTVTWMLNREQAHQLYPQYAPAFERALAQHPELRQRMELGSELVRRWYLQTPEQRGVGAMVQSGDNTASLERNGIRGIINEKMNSDFVTKAKEQIYDSAAPLRKAVREFEEKTGIHLDMTENPADLIHHATKQIPARIALFLGENKGITSREAIDVLSEVYNVGLRYVTMRDVYDTMENMSRQQHIIDYCRNNGIADVHTAVSSYLKSVHFLEIIRERGDNYIIEGAIADHQARVQNAPAEFRQVADMVSDYNYNMLSLAVRFGLIDQGTMDTFRTLYPHYVPLKRSFAEEGIAIEGAKGNREGFANLDAAFHALSERGSDRNVLDPLIQMQLQTATIITKGQKNLVAQQVAALSQIRGGDNLVMTAPPGVTADKAHGYFDVYENGVRHTYKAQNSAVYNVLVMPPDVAGLANTLLGGYLRWTAGALRKGATQTIPFTAWNAVRDSFTAAITTKTVPLRQFYLANPVYFFFNGIFKQLIGRDNVVSHQLDRYGLLQGLRAEQREINAKYEAVGARYATRYRDAENFGAERMQQTQVRDFSSPYGTMRAAKKYAKQAWDFTWAVMTLGKTGEYVENANRYTEFERTLKQGGSLMEAADNAFNITVDFDKKGTLGASTKYSAFTNAKIQGNVKFVKDMARWQTVVPYALMNITLPSMILWWYNKDKPWYKALSIEEKMKNWHLELPNGTIMRLPKCEMLGYLYGSMPERLLDYHFMEDKVDNLNKATGFLSNSFFVQLEEITPTGITPIYEWVTNYKMYTDRKIVDDKHLAMEEKDQYTVYTSELAKGIGKTLYDMPYVSIPKKLTSPALIDNYIRSIGASTASFWLGIMDDATGEHKAPARKNTEKVRFTYTPDTMKSREMDDFMALYDKENKHFHSTGIKSPTLRKIEPFYNKIKNLRQKFNKNYLDAKGSGYNLSDTEKRKIQDEQRDKPANKLARDALSLTGRKYFKK